jgi:GNAT superfamily N-acetyltransferase
MVNFALAEMKDSEALRDISLKAFDDDLKKYGQLPPGIDSIRWHTSKIENGMYYKIMLDDCIVGGINLYDLGNENFCLGAIFVSPEYQNHGIGSKTIEFIEKKYSWVKRWTLDTPYLNTRGHRFYERHGYKKIDELQPEKDVEFYLFIYEKRINNK